MKLLIVDNAEPADAAYNLPLVDAVSGFDDVRVETVQYRQLPLRDPERYDGIILSGVPKSYSYDAIDDRLPYLDWLKDTAVPVLGICLGHQNIGRLFGASVLKDLEAEEGPQALQVHLENPLFKTLGPRPEIIASHRGSISLPDDFVQLASTPACVNQIMKHAQKDIYGVQFHPELSPTGIRLLRNFVFGIMKGSKGALHHVDHQF